MRFGVLGPVEAQSGERHAAIGSGHQRTILAMLLAARGESVSTDRLIDALWGSDPPASARKSLQSHISRLRGELAAVDPSGTDPVVTVSGGYLLDVDAHELDAAIFETLVGEAREVVGDEPDKASSLLEEAKRLWRGPAFGELASHPRVRPEAVRLERLRSRAAADHIDVRLALGQHEDVMGELEAAVAEDPLDERAHRQLMLALYRSSRQADALATFRRLDERLRDEQGVDPSPELRELHQRILRQDGALMAAGPRFGHDRGPAGARSGGVRSGDVSGPLPAPTTELIGRADEVAEIATLITEVPLVTLTGPGGVGKTRVAEQVADEVSGRFDAGVAGCGLAAVRDPDRVGGALVTMLGIHPSAEQSAAETLVEAIGRRHLLLLLDNCEHVLAAVTPLVEEILGRCPNVAILATSRERLHLSAEHIRQIRPLDVPPSHATPQEIAATPSGALFLARAEAVEPNFALTGDNAAAVAELCRRLDGMPLAIELAAARIRALAPADLVERLDERFSLLAGGPRGATDRHRTLQAVVAWSYDLLSEPEAALFERLSVFAGSFTLAAVERVCADRETVPASEVAGHLSELVDKSMVVVEREEGTIRYRLLDTLREFGARRLDEMGDTGIYRLAHADYYVELAEELGPAVRGPSERKAVDRIDAAIDDLRSAHAWMVASGEVDGALRLPVALSDDMFYRLRDEMITWTHRALALDGATTHAAYPAALATAAMGDTHRGQYERAKREANEALDRAEEDSFTTIWALVALEASALYEGRFDDLLTLADRQERIAQQLGDDYHLAFARVSRVLALLYGGQREAAVTHLADLEQASNASGNPTMTAFARYCRGEVFLDTRPAEAAAALGQSIELARQAKNLMIEGVALVSLASLEGRRGRTEQALELFREVVAHWRRRGDYTHQLTTLRNLVVLLTDVGADEPAAVLHGAVTEGSAPSFGAEAQRLEAAWNQLEERLGPEAAAAAATQGRDFTAIQMADTALEHLDAMIGDTD